MKIQGASPMSRRSILPVMLALAMTVPSVAVIRNAFAQDTVPTQPNVVFTAESDRQVAHS